MKKVIFAYIVIVFVVTTAMAQDPSFSQFYFNKLYFNPAFCGLSRGFDASLTHRILWPNVPNKFNTEKLSADIDVSGINGLGGVGIIATSDVEGDGHLKTMDFGVPISIRPMNFFSGTNADNPHYINIQTGFLLKIIYKSIIWDDLVFSDQFDPVKGVVQASSFTSPKESSIIFPDISFGMILDYQHSPFKRTFKNNWNIRAGFAIHHLTQPDYSFLGLNSRYPRKLTTHINFNIPVLKEENLVVAPALVYEVQSDMQTVFFGTNILWRSIFIGAWYRRFHNADAMAFLSGVKIGKDQRCYISYSYDFTVSRLAPSTMGSHEISLCYMIDQSILSAKGFMKDHQKGRNRVVPCPEF